MLIKEQKEAFNDPELIDIQKVVKHKFIFDGELITFEDGRLNFQKMQNVRLFKNKVTASQALMSFITFDILYFTLTSIERF